MRDKDVLANYSHADLQLKKAVDSWHPTRPRWWLSLYGGCQYEPHSGNVHLVEKFLQLRSDASQRVKRVSVQNGSSLPCHVLHLSRE